MSSERRRFTIDLEIELQKRLKIAAALKGVPMRRFCIDALEKELAKSELEARAPTFTRESVERLTAARDKVFKGRKLPGDSAEFIREAREERDKAAWM